MPFKMLAPLAILLAIPSHASQPDQLAISCQFETLPEALFSYSTRNHERVGTLTVGGRGPVPLVMGQGKNRFESGNIDGYGFLWSPTSSWMDVEKEGALLRGERGDCTEADFGSAARALDLG